MEQLPLIISLVIVVAVVLVIVFAGKKSFGKFRTRDIVAIGIGAALYAVVSLLIIPVGPNTSFRIAIALLTILGSIFGPIVGFLAGFIGHALNDAFMYGSVWWSWAFMSAFIGLFAGLICKDKTFDVLGGKINGKQIALMYVLAVAGMAVGSLASYAGDVFLYGEPADKVWLQIIIANAMNLIVVGVIGIPVTIAIAKIRGRGRNLEIEEDPPDDQLQEE